ncbi:MAG: hypothetical protein V1818_01785 [Candidatus Aenigmatarchaeota archaeon]
MCKANILYAIALALGVAAVVMNFTGIAGNYDTAPLLGIAVVCLALACMDKSCCKPVAKKRR